MPYIYKNRMLKRSMSSIFLSIFCFVGWFDVFNGLGFPADTPDDIARSIRSALVFPAHMLERGAESTCDSLSSGPMCVVLGSDMKFPTGGILDKSLWPDVSRDKYKKVYSSISSFIKSGWAGHLKGVPLVTSRVTQLRMISETNDLVFSPHFLAVDSIGFASTSSMDNSSQSIMQLITNYGIMSFVYYQVSVVSFRVRAPEQTNVLVRAYRDGIPIWSRHVEAGQLRDVAAPSSTKDPSIQGIDYIEVIGAGADILSLEVSFSHSVESHNLFMLDKNLENSGVREFSSSAHLVDMETVLRKKMKFRTTESDLSHVLEADQSPIFSYDTFTNLLERRLPDLPAKQAEHFIESLEVHYAGGKHDTESDFVRLFTTRLLESPPELVGFVLKRRSLDEDFVIHPAEMAASFIPYEDINPSLVDAHVIDHDESAINGQQPPSSDAEKTWNTLAKIISENDQFDVINFITNLNLSPAISEVATAALVSVKLLIGEMQFRDYVIAKKVQRLVNQVPLNIGVDEEILRDVLVSAFSLDITKETPVEQQAEILSKTLAILTNPSIHSVRQLARVLATIP